MKKQKICIIGGGLTGLVTALALSDLDINIDLVSDKMNQKLLSNRTVAISENNSIFFDFLKNKLWPCSKMELFSQNKNGNFLRVFDLQKDNKKIFYMIENSKLIKYVFEKIKEKKNINFKNNEKVSKIDFSSTLKKVTFKNHSSKYNLIILCVGKNSNLTKNVFQDNSLKSSYKEVSFTTILNHNKFKNDTARQIFLDKGILALLPLSNIKTSIVWTVDKNLNQNNASSIKENINIVANKFLKNIKFKNSIERNDLKFFVREKYFEDRILLFGDALHTVHPFAGQGFNMILRDLKNLKKILFDRISCGLDIGLSDSLSEFSDQTKPRNFVYSMGLDFLRNCFKPYNKSLKDLRNIMILNINKSDYAKNKIYEIADPYIEFNSIE
tara:strand:+ start:583 stop:1734 length:1152 start_codon:yes stop_codon:yes gene_type:complete